MNQHRGASMNVSLTPQLEEFVKTKVQGGRYQTASEVVREALRLMEERDRYRELRAAVAEGAEQIERGETIPLDMEALKRDARKQSQEGHQVNPLVIP